MDRGVWAAASLLRPVEAGRRLLVVTADERWVFPRDPAGIGTDDVALVWGRGPLPSGTSLTRAGIATLRREAALAAIRMRPPSGFGLQEIHRLGPQRAGTGRIRRRVRRVLLGGAVVELTRVTHPRLLDRVLADAGGLERASPLGLSSGGAAVMSARVGSGRTVLVRLGTEGGDADPAGPAGALRALGSAGLPHVPRLLGEGVTLGVSWTVETRLSGRRPDRLSRSLLRETAAWLARVPRAEGRPTSLAHDLVEIARRAPSRAAAVEPLVRSFGEPDLPAVLRHGDLWAGNLLVARGKLTGVVDWDAWHPKAVPGADLLELFASVERLRARRPLGVVWSDRPWLSSGFADISRPYRHLLDLPPGDDRWETVGLAWWAAKVAGTLRRLPERGHEERWLEEIVDPVIDLLGT